VVERGSEKNCLKLHIHIRMKNIFFCLKEQQEHIHMCSRVESEKKKKMRSPQNRLNEQEEVLNSYLLRLPIFFVCVSHFLALEIF
jgi:hypothetical protein